MNAEELLLDSETSDNEDDIEEKRKRLSAIVAGGSCKQYLGKDLQLSDIDGLTSEQINKLYCRYEARLGVSMTKTLGNSFINLFVTCVSKYFNVVDPTKLLENLTEDPFINSALTTTCCELYYRYGMYLAPFTALLTTARHIDFNKKDIKMNAENQSIELSEQSEKRS